MYMRGIRETKKSHVRESWPFGEGHSRRKSSKLKVRNLVQSGAESCVSLGLRTKDTMSRESAIFEQNRTEQAHVITFFRQFQESKFQFLVKEVSARHLSSQGTCELYLSRHS
jgi:hypothetical protein